MTEAGYVRTFVHRGLTFCAFAIPIAATIFAILWPREQIGQRFLGNGGNIITYDDHVMIRVAVFVLGVLAGAALRLADRRIASRFAPRT